MFFGGKAVQLIRLSITLTSLLDNVWLLQGQTTCSLQPELKESRTSYGFTKHFIAHLGLSIVNIDCTKSILQNQFTIRCKQQKLALIWNHFKEESSHGHVNSQQTLLGSKRLTPPEHLPPRHLKETSRVWGDWYLHLKTQSLGPQLEFRRKESGRHIEKAWTTTKKKKEKIFTQTGLIMINVIIPIIVITLKETLITMIIIVKIIVIMLRERSRKMWSIPKYHHHHLLFALFTQYKKFIIVIECVHHNFSFCAAR